jgi:N-acetylneuraminate synthase/sialic acid synthase
MKRELFIDGVRIADDEPCYLIAEIGHNHQGDLGKCKDLFRAAKLCGASAVKLQKRHNRSLFTREMYASSYNSENAFGPTYGQHREALEFGHDEYEELIAHARQLGITMFATPFDIRSADFLEAFDMPAYKTASGDLTNIPLLRHIAAFGKPLIISTGGGGMDDVRRAYDAVRPLNDKVALLQCTAGYPPAWDQLNLRVIETFREEFPDVVVGLSSHDSGIAMALVAYVLGARIIEKHFTLNRALKGTDHAFSLERPGLEKLVRDLGRAHVALGDGVKRRYASEEQPMYKMAKKLVAARDIPEGHVLTEDDLAIKSPGDGLPPYEIDKLVGKTVRHAMRADQGISFADLRDGA